MATQMSGNAQTSDEVKRLATAMSEALTDSMVNRLATTAGVALEVVDRLNDENTRDAIHKLVDRITELHEIGALDTLFETVLLVHAVRSAATDNIVERLAIFAEELANNLGSDDVMTLTNDIVSSLKTASEQTASTGGIFSVLSLLSKPESQESLQFLLNFGSALRSKQKPGN